MFYLVSAVLPFIPFFCFNELADLLVPVTGLGVRKELLNVIEDLGIEVSVCFRMVVLGFHRARHAGQVIWPVDLVVLGFCGGLTLLQPWAPFLGTVG